MLEAPVYFGRRALRNMGQSPLLCLAAIGTMAFSLAIMALFILTVLNVQKLTGVWSEEMQVVVYLERSPGEAVVKGWIEEVRRLPEVERVAYVSSQQALAAFQKRLGADDGLLDGIEATVLPASLEISLKESFRHPAGVKSVAARLKARPDFGDLRYGQDWLDRFEAFLGLLKAGGAILGGFLVFATLFIVANTIKLTLFARRDELEIMALVGGTSGFIKAPFLLEGALQGAMGGTLALAGVFSLFHFFLREGLSSFLLAAGVGDISFLPPGYQVGLIGAGVLLGVCGSFFSLRQLVRF